jgi:aminoglycoside phosphotransferase (APT) family kinase protein
MGQFVSDGRRPGALSDEVLFERCLGVEIKSVRELPAPRSTSYAVRRLMLQLGDGRTLDVFHKNFDVSPHAADVALSRGMRECFVYEKILALHRLGTPELYGVVWDGPSGHHWLLLEFVQGQRLGGSSDESRVAAAGWLGRLHGSIAGRQGEFADARGPLLSYDETYFRDMAEQALEAVGSRFGSLARRLETVVVGYEAIIEKICSAEQTLVHGSYRTQNILVDPAASPARICPVDWELTAVGPLLHDLAFISDGSDRPMVERLCASYAEGARTFGLSVTRTEEMPEALERLRLHKALRELARSAEWSYSGDVVTKIVARAEKVRRALA